MNRILRIKPGSVILPTLFAFFLVGCSAADMSGLRRDQRALARRLADTRADVDALRGEVARLRGQMQRASMGGATEADRASAYGRPSGPSDGWPGSAVAAAPLAPATPPAQPPQSEGRWPAGGAAGALAQPAAQQPEPQPAATAAAPLGIDLRGDMARGPEVAEYREGLLAFQRGDYSRSIQSLRNFVSRNRDSEVAPYAHYWIGEAYFAQGKNYEAILAYNEILTSWPSNERVPAAKLRQAEAFAATGDVMDARLYLKELIDNYPGTPEAAEAKVRMRSLDRSGR
ncbi:MAG: tol-pal system protein YbgF [Deltaproteobacteria bacterium]